MRSLLFAAAALSLAMPAHAQEAEVDDAEGAAMAEEQVEPMDNLRDRLSDPAEQERMGAMLGAMSEVLLDMPIGPLFAAMERAGGVDAPEVDNNATLRDMAGADAENISAEIADKVPQMMGVMGEMTDVFAAMAPLRGQMAGQMRERVEAAEVD